ncbi:TraR/DksA C4-type zinc finger protein [Halobacteriovorax sp. GB3]|uniref:TraR/DksA family transcriptional regulator n=1 Tax=Halobacteriovorax sp. GB3 TaxID=2719615 RepID=UPI00235E24AE|nr:TraR/DksA C4-type zinc finger protein [Halobacteriovorax sp. GB3]MDD0852201.1 TraR/DksA C4-type zinc finger protein [Halobacteriovorax sp. GB3]
MAINLEHFKNLFLAMKEDNSHLETEAKGELDSRLSGDDADLAMAERDRSMVLKLNQRNAFYNRKIDEALTKIEEGEFGLCEECGDEISEKRLLARPTACLCINCKEENERGEGHLLYAKRSKTRGQEFIVNGENIVKAFKEVSRHQAG